ncbi:hypothetical protein Hte_011944 [Hypoxylon texense]
MTDVTYDFVALRSNDGVSTFISNGAARFSKLLGARIEKGLEPNQAIDLDIEGDTLDKLVKWCEDYFDNTWINSKLLTIPPEDWVDTPEMIMMFSWLWNSDEELFDIFKAAHYLVIEPLVDMAYFSIVKKAESMSDSEKNEYYNRFQTVLSKSA